MCDCILCRGWLRAVAHRTTSARCKWRSILDAADAPPASISVLHDTPLPLSQPHCHRSPFPLRLRFISDSLFDVRIVLLLRSHCIAECVHRTAYRKVFFKKIHYSRQNCKGSLRQNSLPIVSQFCPCTSAVFRVVELKKKYFLSDGVAVATSFLLKKKSKKKKIFDFILNF